MALRKLVTEKKAELGSGLSPRAPAVTPRVGRGRPRRNPERLSAAVAKLEFSDIVMPYAPLEVRR